MRERPNLSTEEAVVKFVSLNQVSQICEQHDTDKEPEEILAQLRRYDESELQEISEREGGFEEFIKGVLITRDAIKENCSKH